MEQHVYFMVLWLSVVCKFSQQHITKFWLELQSNLGYLATLEQASIQIQIQIQIFISAIKGNFAWVLQVPQVV